jgi:chromosomal replication initiator protein
VDVTKDDMEIVSAVHRALAGRVGKERYELWFLRGVRLTWRRLPGGGTLAIAAGEGLRLETLRRTFRGELLAAAREAAGDSATLEFHVDPALALPLAAPAMGCGDSNDSQKNDSHKPVQRLMDQSDAATPANGSLPAVAAPFTSAHTSSPATIRLPRRQFASLADFVASEANRVAYSAAQGAAARPGTYSPLTFIGPPGSGKTHLLEGIWRQIRDSRVLSRVVYLSAEQFTNQFLEALRQTGTPSFRRKVRDVECLLIDDMQFFGGKSSTIVEVVHTLDTLLRDGKQVICSADRPLAELRGLGPELAARLSGGLVCTLEVADYSTRLAILTQLAARQRLEVPSDVLSWMAGQLHGDARQLAGALHRLRAASDAHEQTIDLHFAQLALDDLIHAGRRPVRLPDIVEAVCDVFGVEHKTLQANGKTADVTLPRMLIMFLARKWTRSAHSEISRTLGRKSHSTVVSAQHKVTEWLAAGKTIPLGHASLKLEDAIKRVETQLRLA